MVPPLRFILKEMKEGRSGVSLRAAIGARTEVRRGGVPPSSQTEDDEA